mgnify:CR=1 FL=1
MHKSIKLLITLVAIVVVGGILQGMSKAINGNYLGNNWMMFLLMVGAAAFAFYWILKGVVKMWKTPVIIVVFIIPFLLQSCNYAKSNQQVLVSDDCGMSWKKVNAGDAVPKSGMNPCYMKVVIPNFPMQGESKFIGNLMDHVRATVSIDYDYSIIEPLAFIKQAKYLGKANANADDDEALNNAGFESAENTVIDKRIKDVAKDIFLDEDIVELEQSELEDRLLAKSNKVLEEFGVRLNFITLTFDLDEQTRQAIDVSTAMKIYKSKGLEDLGKQIMIQRAGATKINVENVQPTAKTE